MNKTWKKEGILPVPSEEGATGGNVRTMDEAENGPGRKMSGPDYQDDECHDVSCSFEADHLLDAEEESIPVNDDHDDGGGSDDTESIRHKPLEFMDVAAIALVGLLILLLAAGLASLITMSGNSDMNGGNDGNSTAVIGTREGKATDQSGNDLRDVNGPGEENRLNEAESKSGGMVAGNGSEASKRMTEAPAISASDTESTDDQVSDETQPGWNRLVFGSSSTRTPGQRVALSGISASMRQQTGMLEAALIRKLSSFLEDQDIHTKEVAFHDKVLVSGEEACAYEASIAGYDDLFLTVIFYPKLAGEFIFILSRKTDNAQDHAGRSESASGQNETQQTDPSSQASAQQVGVTAPVSTAAPQPVVPAPEQNNNQTEENPYDATKLTIRSVPQTLLNYIRNRYDFQYSLYDYLYRNGHRNVKKATVSDYEIDGDSRIATISLRLDDGSIVTATYDRDANSFAFH